MTAEEKQPTVDSKASGPSDPGRKVSRPATGRSTGPDPGRRASGPPRRPRTAPAASASSRRGFLGAVSRLFSWFGMAWIAFTGGCVASVLETVRFLYPNALREPPSVFKIGPPDQFAEGEVSTQWKNAHGLWIVRMNGKIFALRSVCTHLGCTPNWLEAEQKFKCPCHGSGFRKNGINFEGPAPRPLERFAVSIADDGQVQVDKSQVLHQELGQWTEENGAFIVVS